jgi:glutamate-1-semialdehyde 2,1-aminomutase
MAATVATLTELTRDDGAAYQRIEATGSALMHGLREIAARLGIPMLVQGYPAAFMLAFTEQPALHDADSFERLTDRPRYPAFALAMLDHGVRVLERGLWYVSAAHDEQHVARTLEAAEASLRAVVGARPLFG